MVRGLLGRGAGRRCAAGLLEFGVHLTYKSQVLSYFLLTISKFMVNSSSYLPIFIGIPYQKNIKNSVILLES